MNKTPSKLMPLLCNMFGMSTKCKKKTVKFAKFTDVYLIHTIDEIKEYLPDMYWKFEQNEIPSMFHDIPLIKWKCSMTIKEIEKPFLELRRNDFVFE